MAEPERPVAEEPGAGAVVLVVDDEAQVLDVTRRALEHAGHAVIAAGDSEAALELVATAGTGGSSDKQKWQN